MVAQADWEAMAMALGVPGVSRVLMTARSCARGKTSAQRTRVRACTREHVGCADADAASQVLRRHQVSWPRTCPRRGRGQTIRRL